MQHFSVNDVSAFEYGQLDCGKFYLREINCFGEPIGVPFYGTLTEVMMQAAKSNRNRVPALPVNKVR